MSSRLFWPCDNSIWSIQVHFPQILLSLRKNGQEESRLLNLRRLGHSRWQGVVTVVPPKPDHCIQIWLALREEWTQITDTEWDLQGVKRYQITDTLKTIHPPNLGGESSKITCFTVVFEGHSLNLGGEIFTPQFWGAWVFRVQIPVSSNNFRNTLSTLDVSNRAIRIADRAILISLANRIVRFETSKAHQQRFERFLALRFELCDLESLWTGGDSKRCEPQTVWPRFKTSKLGTAGHPWPALGLRSTLSFSGFRGVLAGFQDLNSRRPLAGTPFLKKGGVPSHTEGERRLENALDASDVLYIIGVGRSQPCSQGEFQEKLWE